MSRQIPIEKLHELLRTAAEEGIIDEWMVDGPDVIFIHDGKPNPVPAFEAAAFLESLFRQRRASHAEPLETEER